MDASTTELLENIRGYLGQGLLAPEAVADLSPDDPLITSGLLSSIAVLSLVAMLEDELDIELSAHEISPDYMDSLTAIAELVQSKRGPT